MGKVSIRDKDKGSTTVSVFVCNLQCLDVPCNSPITLTHPFDTILELEQTECMTMMVSRFDGVHDKTNRSWVYRKRNPDYLEPIDTTNATILERDKDYVQLSKQERGGLRLTRRLTDFVLTVTAGR